MLQVQPLRTYGEPVSKFSISQPKKLATIESTPRRERERIRVNTTTGKLLSISFDTSRGRRELLIDTGAGINLLKRSKVNTQIYTNSVKSFYMGQDNYKTNEYEVIDILGKRNKFHIVPDDFPLIEDGIIGLPCHENYEYEISNDKLKLDGKTLQFQKPPTVKPGETRVRTNYLESKPMRVCFINSGKTEQTISNQIYNINEYDQI